MGFLGVREILTLQAAYGRRLHQSAYDRKQRNQEYVVQDGTTHIGQGAFARCTSLSKVVLPEGLISIGAKAFFDCHWLSDINLPDSVERIGEKAFSNTILKNFALGSSLREIGLNAFITGNDNEDERTKLRSVKVNKNNPYYYVESKALMMRKPDASSAIVVYFGGDEVAIIPEGVSEIFGGAFSKSIVQEVQIPSSVTVIGEGAFAGCSKLVRLKVEFSEPENNISNAVIYLPENKRTWDYEASISSILYFSLHRARSMKRRVTSNSFREYLII